jgi:hypothetical protein
MTDASGSWSRGKTVTEFAPRVPFDEVDLFGDLLPEQFEERIRGFYLTPARVVTEAGSTFAAGLLLVASIDALARLTRPEPEVGIRFVRWMTSELPGFGDENLSRRFYREFRNGLVHECRIKNGGKFALVSERETVRILNGVLIVNVRCLFEEVDDALRKYIELLRQNLNERNRLSTLLLKEFEYEFAPRPGIF